MEVMVMSRETAARYCRSQHRERVAAIGISTPGEDSSPIHAEHGNGIKHVLKLAFADVDDRIAPDAITGEQAETIARFVTTHAEDVDAFLVHCDTGISRSAGIAAAILKALTGNDAEIYDDPRYHPNALVRRLVLEAILEQN